MKKQLLIITNILLAHFLFSYDFTCIVDSEATIYSDTNSIFVEKADALANNEILVSTDKIYDNYFLIKDYEKTEKYINPENLSLKNSLYFNKLFNNKKWLLTPCVDALYTSESSLVYEYTGNIKEYIIKNQNSMDFPEHTWDEYVGPIIFKHFKGVSCSISIENKVNWSITDINFCIVDITESEITIFTTFIYNPYNFDIKYNQLNLHEVYQFKYELDGDYLNLYLDDKLFLSFVNADESLIQEYTDFIQGRDYLLSNAKWPKHSDGTCDYDDSIPNYYGEVVVSLEDDPEYVKESELLADNSFDNSYYNRLAVNKIYELLLDAEIKETDSEWSNSVCKASKKTKVKIIQICEERAVIHSAVGKWIKVEILDTESKEKIGYIFSGYLIETEQEDSKTDSSINYLPFVFIGIGVIVLAFIVLLVIKKKKSKQ